LGNKVTKYIISSKTAIFRRKNFKSRDFCSDLVNFFCESSIFAEKPVAALLLASFEQSIQQVLDWFSAACDQAAMEINTKGTEVLSLQKPKAVHAASEWHCTAEAGEVQVGEGEAQSSFFICSKN